MSSDRDRHDEFEELISASLHGDITDEERRRLDAHLDRCAACRGTLAAFAEQRRIMAGLRHVPPPRDLGARVRAGIERDGPARRHWWQRPPAIFAGVGGGLALVAGALLALVVLGEPTDEPEVGQTSPTPSIAVATPSTPDPTLEPLETPAATPIPTLPPASFAPGESVEPVPSVAPAQESPEPEVFLAVTPPSDEQAMTLNVADASETGTAIKEVSPPDESTAVETAVPVAAELSPDGQWLAFIVDLGPSGLSEVRATRMNSGDTADDPEASPPLESEVAVGETVLLAESVSGSPFADHLFWSSDSRYLAFTAVDREGGGTDVHVFLPATGDTRQATDVGNAYAASWVPGNESGTSLLWVSTAGETPQSHLLPFQDDAAEIEPVDPADGDFPGASNVFQPLLSPNGALVIYWTGLMQQQDGGEWQFTDGGSPWLAENHEDGELGFRFESAREVFRDVTIRQSAFSSAAIRWGLDSDAYVIWDVAWEGENQSSGDGQYPDPTRVYLTRASDPRGMQQVHAIDAGDIPEQSTVIDVKVAGTGRHLAITAQKITPGDLSPREAELFLITRNTGDVPDEQEILGSQPEFWFGPAVFTPEQWAELTGE